MTEYVIASDKTRAPNGEARTFLRFHTGNHVDWCCLGEGEARFGSMTEAVLAATEHGVTDYRVELVDGDSTKEFVTNVSDR